MLAKNYTNQPGGMSEITPFSTITRNAQALAILEYSARERSMGRSVKEQVKSERRLGGGLAMFFLAMAPLVDELRRVAWAAPPHRLLWAQPIGWVELIVAAALLFYTARIWMQWIAGCVLIGSIKGIVVFIAGAPISRLESAEVLIALLATLVPMVAIGVRGPTLLDQVALTFYVFCLTWRADQGLFTPSPSLAIGLAALFVSWASPTGSASHWRN
jgi:hypothetical protein